jgi:FAD/FMN-containing dehydrogenase
MLVRFIELDTETKEYEMVQGIAMSSTLQSQIQGQIIYPGDSEYEEARLAWNRSVNQHPALIVVSKNTADISTAVEYARENNLDVAVQSTGHGVTLPADGALLLITSQLKDLHIDAAAQTAWIGAGLKWGEVLEQTQKVGLAPLLGSSPGVGVVGYTLGGGYGWLGRKYGLASDSVISFELVDASGQTLCANADENSDLFWGLRGGGGSFGVITGMQIRLYPVTKVYGGNLLYPADQAREVIQHYHAWIASAPDELTSSIVLMNVPPIPQLPEFLRGKSFVMVRGAYVGSTAEGERLLKHWRTWKAPVMDDWKEMPFSQVAAISSDPLNPMPSKSTGAWLHDLNDSAVDTLIQYAFPPVSPRPMTMVEVRHFGGAVARVAPESAAFCQRGSSLLMFAVGAVPTPEANCALSQYMEKMKQALEPSMDSGEYMNFLTGEEARQKARSAFSEVSYRRLQALKAQVDPDNRFRFGFNIISD